MKSIFASLALGAVLSTGIVAQTTTHQILLGGAGSTGCSGGVMTNGQPATATIDFTYDAGTQTLSVGLTNTSPAFPGLKVPVITRFFFNLPHGALTSMTLLSQSAASGPLNWDFDYDVNIFNGSGINSGCMGDWGVRLKTPNGVGEGIANAAELANTATSGYATGPALFAFHCSGPGAANLTAGAFAASLSANSDKANALIHFQGGGTDGGISGWIANNEECSAGAWFIGEPRINSTVDFVQTSANGCYGCIIASLDPGPTVFGNLVAPVGLPYIVITSALFPNGSGNNTQTVGVYVPNQSFLVGVTFYCCVVTVDLATQTQFSISDQFTVTILPAL